MEYQEELLELPDGRILEVATMGEPAGPTVVFHHGTPGSAPLLKSLAPLLERAELFLVTTSRAGYGNSSRLEGRTIASVVNDVRAVLDDLGRQSYAAVGWSGGGPHALACAALDSPRCVGAWSLAGVAPMDADFDWTEGMGPENLEEFALAQEGGPAYEAYMAEAGTQFLDVSADNVVASFGGLLSEPDKESLASEESREVLASAIRHGFSSGYRGFYDDDQAFFAPWGFDVRSISVPVSLWFGDADLMVPPTHGSWLARSISTSSVHHKPEEGHVSIVANHLDELASELLGVFE